MFFRFLSGAVRLPVNIVLFTYDFCRLTWWLILCLIRLLLSEKTPRYTPCAPREWRTVGEKQQLVCVLSHKYKSGLFTRLLCHWRGAASAPETGLVWTCRRDGHFRVRAWNYLVCALLLGGFWSGLGYVAWRASGITLDFSLVSPRRAALTPARTDSLIDDLRAAAEAAGAGAAATAAAAPANVDSGAALQRVDRALAAGDATEASRLLRPLADAGAEHYDVQIRLARLASLRGEADGVRRHAGQALVLRPGDGEASMRLVRDRLVSRDLDGARRLAQAAVEADPNAALAVAALGLTHAAAGETDAAERCFRQVLDLDGAVVEAHLGLGRLMRLRGDHESADAHLRQALDLEPGNVDAATTMAETLAGRGNANEAIAVYRRLAAANPRADAGRARMAELLARIGRQDDAYTAATALLADDPGNLFAHLVLADMFRRQGLLTLAAEHCRKACTQAPQDVRPRKLLAQILVEQRQDSEAIALLRGLAEVLPNDLDVLLWLAAAVDRVSGGTDANALTICKLAAERHPASAAPWVELARLQRQRGDPDAARATLERALQVEPESSAAALAMAEVLFAAGDDFARCRLLLQSLAKSSAATTGLFSLLGQVALRQEQAEDAIQYLSLAVAGAPNAADSRYHLGCALEAVARHPEAAEQYRAAVAADPESASGVAARDRLRELAAASPATAE